VPPAGILIILLVCAGIGVFWWNEFKIDPDQEETTLYRTGAHGHSPVAARKIHYAVPQVSSLKDCEKIVSDALKDYVEKQAAVAAMDDDEDEKPKKGKGGGKKGKSSDDDEDDGKSKKGAKGGKKK